MNACACRYCWHFPELRELVKDNYVFARCAAYIQDRTQLTEVRLSVRVPAAGSQVRLD